MHLKKGSIELKFDEEKLDGVLRHLYAANKAVKVGILENATNADTGASIAEYAYWNEFGTKDEEVIPARPFFRNAISDNSDTWAKSISSQLKTMGVTDKNVVEKTLRRTGQLMRSDIQQTMGVTDKNVVEKTLRRTGQLMRSDIQQSISKGNFKPLAPETIARKEGRLKELKALKKAGQTIKKSQYTIPLKDTGDMFNAISYEVVDSRGE